MNKVCFTKKGILSRLMMLCALSVSQSVYGAYYDESTRSNPAGSYRSDDRLGNEDLRARREGRYGAEDMRFYQEGNQWNRNQQYSRQNRPERRQVAYMDSYSDARNDRSGNRRYECRGEGRMLRDRDGRLVDPETRMMMKERVRDRLDQMDPERRAMLRERFRDRMDRDEDYTDERNERMNARDRNQDNRAPQISGQSQEDDKLAKDIQYALSPGYFSKGYGRVQGQVRNGYVMLGGSVSSQQDKDNVEKAVRKIQGVRDVQNRVQVLDMNEARRPENQISSKLYANYFDQSTVTRQPSDAQISEKVREALSPGMFTQGYDDVSSDVTNGIVYLTGTVETQNDNEKLEKAVRKIDGVRDVRNEVEVVNNAGARRDANTRQPSDAEIAEEVRDALAPGMFTQGYNRVSSEVSNGTVRLTGSVETQNDKAELEKTVRGIDGVRAVKNEVQVLSKSQGYNNTSNTRQPSDTQIAKEVRDALAPGMFTKGYDRVSSDVSNGTVVLTGTVQSQSDREKLEKSIRKIDGVRDVRNNVRVLDAAASAQSR